MTHAQPSLLAAISLAACGCLMIGGCAAPGSGRPTLPGADLTTATTAGPSPSTSPTSSSPTATAQCPVEVPAALTVTKGTLPKGTSFGFVRFFDATAIYVDPAEFFGNEAAVKAARKDGEIGPHEDLPNPFYIRNHSTAIVRVPVAATLRVRVIDNQESTEHSITTAEFASLYCGGPRPDWLYSNPEDLPANLTITNGQVVRVEEQYVP